MFSLFVFVLKDKRAVKLPMLNGEREGLFPHDKSGAGFRPSTVMICHVSTISKSFCPMGGYGLTSQQLKHNSGKSHNLPAK